MGDLKQDAERKKCKLMISQPVICFQKLTCLGFFDPTNNNNKNTFWGDLTDVSAKTKALIPACKKAKVHVTPLSNQTPHNTWTHNIAQKLDVKAFHSSVTRSQDRQSLNSVNIAPPQLELVSRSRQIPSEQHTPHTIKGHSTVLSIKCFEH